MKNLLAGFNRGGPDLDELGRGMHLCFVNASSLIQDAELLLDKSPGLALSLAILAMEEIGKVFVLCDAAAAVAIKPRKWKEIRQTLQTQSHQHKLLAFAEYGSELLKIGHGYHDRLPSDLVPLMDKMKQLGFYVDYYEGQFVSPHEFGTDNVEWTKYIISLVKERIDSLVPLHGTQEKSREIAARAGNFAKAIRWAKTPEDMHKAITDAVTLIHSSNE